MRVRRAQTTPLQIQYDHDLCPILVVCFHTFHTYSSIHKFFNSLWADVWIIDCQQIFEETLQRKKMNHNKSVFMFDQTKSLLTIFQKSVEHFFHTDP